MSLDFRSLLLALEDRLGTCHVLVNRQAKEPAGILLPTGVHDTLVRELARAVYRNNRCYHVRARVQEVETLRALLPGHTRVIEDPATDWATVQFLDRFHAAVRASFAGARRATTHPASSRPPREPAGARIFSFPVPARPARAV